jgi:ABC-type uncharacterized transport system involved in gliding motility auxiliary subunit
MIKSDETRDKIIHSLIISILIILNIIAFIIVANLMPFRIDMTQGATYSVSKPTVELLRKIDPQNPMIIEYYYSDKCKEIGWMAQVVQYVIDMLKEYENSGKGLVNVIIKQLNYEKDKADIDALEAQGIEGFQLRSQEQTEAKTLLGYSGIIIKYKNQIKVMSVVYQDVGFEYKLDTEIKKIVETESNKIAMLIASEGKTLNNDYKNIYDGLVEEYTAVQQIRPPEKIPNDIGVLVILGGNNLSDYDIYQIDQFLMNGGKALIAINGVQILSSQYGINAMPNDSKLFDLLSSYGIKINRDIVGDNESFSPVIQRQNFFIEYRYPIWPRIKGENFSKTNPIVQNMTSLNLFWASSIDIEDRIKSNSEFLFHTTIDSWNEDKDYNVELEKYFYPREKGNKIFNLAYTFKGRLSSYFEKKEIPDAVKKDKEITRSLINSGETQLVVVGNEVLFDNGHLRENESKFFLNSVDWLTKDFSLLQIRDKGKFFRPLDKGLKQLKKFKSTLIIVISTYIIPIVIIALGVILIILRRLKDKELKVRFIKKKVK